MWQVRGHVCLSLRQGRHSRGFYDFRGTTVTTTRFLNHYHLLLIHRIARVAQATLPDRYLLSGRAEVTVVAPIVGERATRTYGRPLACP